MSLIRSQLNVIVKWPLLNSVANSVVQSLVSLLYLQSFLASFQKRVKYFAFLEIRVCIWCNINLFCIFGLIYFFSFESKSQYWPVQMIPTKTADSPIYAMKRPILFSLYLNLEKYFSIFTSSPNRYRFELSK